MVTPNSSPGDSGRKFLLSRALETRKASKKSTKDFWDKADIVAKGAIGLFTAIVAIVVGVIGWKLQESIATQNTGKDYIQIALGILEQKDLPEDLKRNKGLRKWAVYLLNHYSPKELDTETATELINGETNLPHVFTSSTPPPAEPLIGSVLGKSSDSKLTGIYSRVGEVTIINSETKASAPLLTVIGARDGGVTFSPDNSHVVVYDNTRLSILTIPPDVLGSSGSPPAFVEPGVQSSVVINEYDPIMGIEFERNDAIVVTIYAGRDAQGQTIRRRETYDLTGKPIRLTK